MPVQVAKKTISSLLKEDFKYFSTTVFFGITSKLYTLGIFLISIKLVAGVFKNNGEEGGGKGLLLMLDGFSLPLFFIAIALMISFVLVGVLDFYFVKSKSVFLVRGLSRFGELKKESQLVTTKRGDLLSNNAFRLMLDDWMACWVFGFVCLSAWLFLVFVNVYFGFILATGGLLFLLLFQILPSDVLGSLMKKIPQLYVDSIAGKFDAFTSESRKMLLDKYSPIYIQQFGFVFSHILMGFLLGILVLSSSFSVMLDVSLFELVVFIYVARFISNNGRNCALSFVKFKSRNTLLKESLE